jgi:hypothetical protein
VCTPCHDRAVHRVYLELGKTKVFACSLDWPGWCRSGRSEELALEALDAYTDRYRVIAERAGLRFRPGEPSVVDRVPGDATTDFGAPGAFAPEDGEPSTARQAKRAAVLVQASWEYFAEVLAGSPAELRKGPRGGGRDRDKMAAHVVDAERSYARKIGVRHPPVRFDDADALAVMRSQIIGVLTRASDGEPAVPKGWPVRYAARRIAWHVLDHAWEMQDRSEPLPTGG